MNRGMTMSPSVDEEGNLVDVQIEHRGQPMNRSGIAPQGWRQNEATGETAIFSENNPDVDVSSNYDATYVQALMDSNPELPAALDYARKHWTPEQHAKHDALVFSDNYDDVNQGIENLIAEFKLAEANGATVNKEEKQSQPEDEEEEIPNVSSLYEAEPDQELASQWGEVATQSEGAYALLAQLSQQFHLGNASQDELIAKALESDFSRDELLAAYKHFTNNN